MSLLEFFEDKKTTKTDKLTDPNLPYDEWKVLTRIDKKGYFKHPITGNIRDIKFSRNTWEKHVKSLQTKIETEEFIKEILKDKTLPMKQCKDCKKWYPAIQEYNGKPVSFWVTNKKMKDRLRSFCGKWGTTHEYESYGKSVLSLGCDAERDRRRKITPENPTGIKRGGKSDHSDRMKHKDKILRRLVSAKKTTDARKDLVCNLPDDWAVVMADKQNDCCGRTGHPFDYTHKTKEKGNNILKPSINRIDNTKPHTVDNCELVLMFVNLGCSNASKDLVDRVCSELFVKKAA
jgi:hypothetical protein